MPKKKKKKKMKMMKKGTKNINILKSENFEVTCKF